MIRLSIDGRILALFLSPACILFACFAPCSYTCAGRRTRAQGWWWRFKGLDTAGLLMTQGFFQPSILHLPLCHCVRSVLVLLRVWLCCCVCVCCCVWVCYIYITHYLVKFRFEYNITRSSISPFSERNRGVTEMGTYLMKILTHTFLLFLLVLIIVIQIHSYNSTCVSPVCFSTWTSCYCVICMHFT